MKKLLKVLFFIFLFLLVAMLAVLRMSLLPPGDGSGFFESLENDTDSQEKADDIMTDPLQHVSAAQEPLLCGRGTGADDTLRYPESDGIPVPAGENRRDSGYAGHRRRNDPDGAPGMLSRRYPAGTGPKSPEMSWQLIV